MFRDKSALCNEIAEVLKMDPNANALTNSYFAELVRLLGVWVKAHTNPPEGIKGLDAITWADGMLLGAQV
tara:strand:+ start:575 stop:784 length:210 start_codon:yes stop_codon:yes gene_type:complete